MSPAAGGASGDVARTAIGTEPSGDSFHVGQKAPDFMLVDALTGKQRSLESFRGKTVLLNFWAMWCAPCVAELPALERLSQKFKSRGLEVVAISADPTEDSARLKQFIRDRSLSFTVLHDGSMGVPESYGVSGFPETFFIDPEGRFMSFEDPLVAGNRLRIISDRPWDSAKFLAAIEKMLPEGETHVADDN